MKKAGTLILAASILIWFLTNYPSEVSYSKNYEKAKNQVEETFDAQIAENVFMPLGLETVEDQHAFETLASQIDNKGIQVEKKNESYGMLYRELKQQKKLKSPK